MRIKILALFIAISLMTACGYLSNAAGNGSTTPKSEAQVSVNSNGGSAETKLEPATLPERKNLLALGNGSFPIAKTSEFSGRWRAVSLVDELSKIGWASARDKIADQSVTIELNAKTTLQSLVFDTAGVDEEGTAAKDIFVEISDTNAAQGYQLLLTATLQNQKDAQEFPIKQIIAGRWLRLTVKNNYGSPNFIEVMEMRGYGEQEETLPLQNISGTYESSYGNFHLKQEGTSVIGCYEMNSGLFDGGVENRVMKLNWNERDVEGKGPALMFFSQDGKQFLGVWAHGDSNDGFPGEWNGKKISDKVGNCEHYKTLEAAGAGQNKITDKLQKSGRAIVYGINFDFNSDTIKPESKPALDQIVGVLKENKDWKMTVEGHTDNVGGAASNKALSEKRANAVKAYLIGKGIESLRLNFSGLGLTKPVASNETEAGRAQNRRVELVKN
ncbi:MAG: OmpA family protein [Pyrinomonadaceae bacterium]